MSVTERDLAELELREVTGEVGLLEKIYLLRVAAWSTEVPEFALVQRWCDEWDSNARHWAIISNGEPVASARFSVHTSLAELPHAECYANVFSNPPQSPIASFNRLVVHPMWRGYGLSRKLDAVRLEVAALMGCNSAIGVTDSGEARIRQMLSLGFVIVCEAPVSTASGPQTNNPLMVMSCALSNKKDNTC